MHEVAVPQGVYRHLQYGFAINNARECVKHMNLEHRIFHPGDPFVNVIKWLWGGIQGGEVTLDGRIGGALSGELLACQLLVDHFRAFNDFLAELEPAPQPMSIEEMITGLGVAGLEELLGQREWERICVMIREDVPDWAGLR